MLSYEIIEKAPEGFCTNYWGCNLSFVRLPILHDEAKG
jgi:hypothetical protein